MNEKQNEVKDNLKQILFHKKSKLTNTDAYISATLQAVIRSEWKVSNELICI